ncbi:MAG: hypothetical protein AAGJ81_13070 [Verrucomicrobiota bacterium]
MKILRPLILLFPVVFVSCANDRQDGEGAESPTVESAAAAVQSAGDTASDWTRDAGYWMIDTWDSIEESTVENTAKVKASLENASALMKDQIDAAQSKAAELTGKAKAKMDEGIEGLKKARDEIVDASQRVSNATAAQWPEVKKEIAEAWTQAGQSLKEIWSAADDSPSNTGD